MGTPAAPRLDDRLRRYIGGASFFDSPAEVTRQVGELAWELGLPRPSYQRVRELMGGAGRVSAGPKAAQTSRGRVVLQYVARGMGILYEYPGPGLGDWYMRYKRGGS